MKNIVIFGAPGSGKGTQSDKIIAEFGVEHIGQTGAVEAFGCSGWNLCAISL